MVLKRKARTYADDLSKVQGNSIKNSHNIHHIKYMKFTNTGVVRSWILTSLNYLRAKQCMKKLN